LSIPDFGKSQLPSIKAATAAGVKVVPWAADPGGDGGKDFVTYVDWDVRATGQVLAEWVAKAIHDKGDVVFLGGPAGNPVSAATLEGIHDVFKDHPGINLVTGYKDWAVSNWDPSQTQKVLSSLQRRTGRSCRWRPSKATCWLANTQRSSRSIPASNWRRFPAATGPAASPRARRSPPPKACRRMSRDYKLPLFENTLGGAVPQCDPKQAPDASLSAKLLPEERETYGKTE
jgi:hypothetical protein